MQDERLIFFEDTSLARTTAAGATQVGDILYLGHAQNLGPGTPIDILIEILTEVDSAGDGASLEFSLEVANEVAFDTTNEVVWSSGAIAEATLVKGYQVPGCRYINKSKTYARILTTATGENVTAGVGSAMVQAGMQQAGETTTKTTP